MALHCDCGWNDATCEGIPEPKGWIPVSERLPENPTIGVLVWHKSGVFSLASWYGNREPHECLADEQCGWRQWRVWQVLHPDYGGGIHGNEPGDEITHWLSLPEPPKE